jgi:hypothetical protein
MPVSNEARVFPYKFAQLLSKIQNRQGVTQAMNQGVVQAMAISWLTDDLGSLDINGNWFQECVAQITRVSSLALAHRKFERGFSSV